MQLPAPKRLFALLFAFAIVATACGGPSSGETDSAAATTSTATEEAVTTETAEATTSEASADTPGTDLVVPQLTGEFQTVNGTSIDLETLQGEDVVLWFWAPW